MTARILLLVMLLLTQGLALGQVYRWVDDQGRVHFTDQPPDGKGEAVAIPKSPADKGTASSSRSGGVPDRQRLLQMYEKRRAERKAAKAREVAERVELKNRCNEVTQTLRSYHQAGPLYEDRSDGRYFYSAAEKDLEMARLRALLDQHCGGVPRDLRPRGDG